MFEKKAEEWVKENMDCCRTDNSVNHPIPYFDEEERCCAKSAFIDGAEFGYNSAIEWFDAKERIPVPKQAGIHRYTNEAISDNGDIVCYDYKDKCWKKIVIEDERITCVPVEIKMWCNKPTKEMKNDRQED